MRSTRFVSVIAKSACVVLWCRVSAAAPLDGTFNYQGRLTDAGAAVTGTADLKFRLYDDAAAGALVGSEIELLAVPVTGGLFNVDLDFGLSSFDGDQRWLEIDARSPAGVGGYTTLLPRQPIAAAPYALYALDSPGGGLWESNGNDISNSNTGNVGIGTTNPTNLLHVVGDTGINHAIYGHTTETVSGAAGVYGRSDSTSGFGLYGRAYSSTGINYGVYGLTNSTLGRGVFGRASIGTGQTYGVFGQSQSSSGTGVYGLASSTSGNTNGVFGQCDSPNGFAGRFHGRGYFSGNAGFGGVQTPLYPVHAFSNNTNAIYGASNNSTAIRGEGVVGIEGNSTDPDGRGVFGFGASITGTNYGVYGLTASPDGTGVYGYATNSTGTTFGVYGKTDSAVGRAVYGNATATTSQNYGVYGVSASPNGEGVFGWNTATTGVTSGVHGQTDSDAGNGVYGHAASSTGFGIGVAGKSDSVTGFDFYAAGAGVNYGEPSSRRWKSNIEPIDDPLGKISQIRGVYFDWDENHGGKHDVGMIAEEVGAVLPEIVVYEENGMDAIGMDYSKMTPLLVEAVNALRAEKDAEIAELRTRIEELEAIAEQLASNRRE